MHLCKGESVYKYRACLGGWLRPRPAPSGATAHVWHQVCNGPGPLEIVFDSTHVVGLRSQLTPTTKPRLCLVVGCLGQAHSEDAEIQL